NRIEVAVLDGAGALSSGIRGGQCDDRRHGHPWNKWLSPGTACSQQPHQRLHGRRPFEETTPAPMLLRIPDPPRDAPSRGAQETIATNSCANLGPIPDSSCLKKMKASCQSFPTSCTVLAHCSRSVFSYPSSRSRR